MFQTKNILNRIMGLGLLAGLGFVTLLSLAQTAPALAAAVAPDLGTAAPFAVLGTNTIPTIGTVTCTDSGPGTGITGDVGTSFNGGITSSCTITGATVTPVAASVVTAFNAAKTAIDASNSVCTGVIPIVSTTLAPGVYCSAAGTTIGAGVILTLSGNASDVWVFRVGTGGPGALTLTNAQVNMGGSALACNVYWKTSAGATITNSTFNGTVLSGAAVTMTNGSWTGRAMATTDVTLNDPAPLTFAGCAAPASITVNKDFIPNNVATVPVALTCNSGTVSTTPLNAAEGAPAVFTVGGANLVGTTCTATETVPAGYTANQAGCVGVALNGSCTITNTLNSATITVNKDFIPNNAATVPIALNCTSGTVSTTPLNAAEGAPAVFTVTGALTGATCTATETVPAGYTANQAGCVGVALNGSCTITNTVIAATSIPTLNEWGMIIFMGLAGLGSVYYLRRLRARA
jgi:hypothetical protein